jgi:hypothetical protein
MVREIKKIPLMLMGVLAPESAHTRPSARLPIKMSQHFPPHLSLFFGGVGILIFFYPLKSGIPIFRRFVLHALL